MTGVLNLKGLQQNIPLATITLVAEGTVFISIKHKAFQEDYDSTEVTERITMQKVSNKSYVNHIS